MLKLDYVVQKYDIQLNYTESNHNAGGNSSSSAPFTFLTPPKLFFLNLQIQRHLHYSWFENVQNILDNWKMETLLDP